MWWAASAKAQETGDTSMPTDTAPPVATNDTATDDTTSTVSTPQDTAPWVDGLMASDLAAEHGGAPFSNGCSHVDMPAAAFGVALGLAWLVRVGRTPRRP